MPWNPGERDRVVQLAAADTLAGRSPDAIRAALIRLCARTEGCTATGSEIYQAVKEGVSRGLSNREIGPGNRLPIPRNLGVERDRGSMVRRNSYTVRVDCTNRVTGETVTDWTTVSSTEQLAYNALYASAVRKISEAWKSTPPDGVDEYRPEDWDCVATLEEYRYEV